MKTNKLILLAPRRSGSTFALKLFKAQNPDYYCFEEPYHPNLYSYGNQKFGEIVSGSYKDIYSDYRRLNEKEFANYYVGVGSTESTIVEELEFGRYNEDLLKYTKYLLYSGNKVLLQPVRAIGFLETILEIEDVKVIYLERDIYDCVSSCMGGINNLINGIDRNNVVNINNKILIKLYRLLSPNSVINWDFWEVDKLGKRWLKYLGVVDPNNTLDLIISYYVLHKIKVEKCLGKSDKLFKKVQYNEICKNPSLLALGEFIEIDFQPKYKSYRRLDWVEKRINNCSEKLKNVVL